MKNSNTNFIYIENCNANKLELIINFDNFIT